MCCVGVGLAPHFSDEHHDDDAAKKKNLVGIELMAGIETEVERDHDDRRQPPGLDDTMAERGGGGAWLVESSCDAGLYTPARDSSQDDPSTAGFRGRKAR